MHLPLEALAGQTVQLRDALGDAVYDRSGADILADALYLDLPGRESYCFEVRSID